MSTSEEKKKTRPAGEETRNAAEDAARAQATMDLMGAGGSLDKVRDILFGANMRDYEKRFTLLEDKLLKESGELRTEVKKRLDGLEAYVKKELESLNDRLKAEHDERTTSTKAIIQELRDFSQNTEKRISQLDEFTTKTQRELRHEMLNQHKELSEDIRQKAEALSGALEKAFKELRGDKTDRFALAALFTEMAMRLNNQFKLPGSEG